MFPENHGSQAIAHAPFHNHLAKDGSDLLEISGGAAGNFIENDLFSAPSAESHTDLGKEMGFGDEGPFFVGQHHGIAAGLASGDDGDFVDRIRILEEGGHDGMARFMVSGQFLFIIIDFMTLSFRAIGNLFGSFFQIGHGNGLPVGPGSHEGCFV